MILAGLLWLASTLYAATTVCYLVTPPIMCSCNASKDAVCNGATVSAGLIEESGAFQDLRLVYVGKTNWNHNLVWCRCIYSYWCDGTMKTVTGSFPVWNYWLIGYDCVVNVA